MIDTIRVKFPISPTDFQLEAWTRITSRIGQGEKVRYIYNPVSGSAVLRFTYFPEDYNGFPMLTLETSLPKWVYGNNYQMLGNIEEAIKIANERLAKVRDIPVLDLAEGILIRLDMCYNHQVGDAVDDYIKALGNLDYPHRRTKSHRYEGVEYRAKHKVTKFYNKEHESGSIEARGILRQEITMLKGKDIQKLTSIKRPTLLDVPVWMIEQSLKDDLQSLGLLNNSIANRSTALKMLCETYGEDAGFYYFGLLITKETKPKKHIKALMNKHPRSLDRKLKKIRDAGMPVTLTDREEPLPPLTIQL
ncbi:MAG: hypothetical protein H6634_00045 [Anaerolineales bacterium]|nr:hypothetical protein [Anaerolineales bacterium]